MIEFAVRWRNFRSLEDTGWLEIRPLTIILGPNASGKTSLIAPLLVLKQTVESVESSLAMKTQGALFNAGTYRNLIFSHSAERTLSLGLRFHFHDPKQEKEEIKPVGNYPPGVAELDFVATDNGLAPILQRYAIHDILARPMLVRKRLKSGFYSLGGPLAPTPGIDLFQAAKRSSPIHFMFTAESVFREQYRQDVKRSQQHRERSADNPPVHLKIEAPIQRYLAIITYVEQYFESLLSRIAYVGPLRERPQRLYELSGEAPETVGVRGEAAPEIIFRNRGSELNRIVNKWINRFDFGFDLQCEDLSEGVFNVVVRRTNSSPPINLADTGFGLSQVLPLIVQGVYAPPDSLMIAEQPEIHLNPKLQTVLADLFVDVAKHNRAVLVETHSEHLLLRLRRLVAEGEISAENVALYFVEREGDKSQVREVSMKQNGHIPDWPKGCFGESLRESLALAAAQDRRKPNA